MARKPTYYSLGWGLTRAEMIAGWCYLPVYLVLLSSLIQYVAMLLKLPLTALSLNLVYFAVNMAAVLIIFHNLLRQPFFGGHFWNFVQAIILGGVLYYVGTYVIDLGISLLGGNLTLYNDETVTSLVSSSKYVMLAVTVLAAPVIEETLVRGLVFGSVRQLSRVAGYIVSVLIFTLMHNWQYFALHSVGSVLLSCLPYIPAGIALAWTYEKAGTIWAPITLHAMINAVSYGVVNLSR